MCWISPNETDLNLASHIKHFYSGHFGHRPFLETTFTSSVSFWNWLISLSWNSRWYWFPNATVSCAQRWVLFYFTNYCLLPLTFSQSWALLHYIQFWESDWEPGKWRGTFSFIYPIGMFLVKTMYEDFTLRTKLYSGHLTCPYFGCAICFNLNTKKLQEMREREEREKSSTNELISSCWNHTSP